MARSLSTAASRGRSVDSELEDSSWEEEERFFTTGIGLGLRRRERCRLAFFAIDGGLEIGECRRLVFFATGVGLGEGEWCRFFETPEAFCGEGFKANFAGLATGRGSGCTGWGLRPCQ